MSDVLSKKSNFRDVIPFLVLHFVSDALLYSNTLNNNQEK
jgi:hypothetical protein